MGQSPSLAANIRSASQ